MIYNYLVCGGQFFEEQKGCRYVIKGAGDIHRSAHLQGDQNEEEKCIHGMDWQQNHLLYCTVNLDNRTLKNVQDMRLNYKIHHGSDEKVELTAGRKTLAEVKIQRGIFLGDSLSSLLFVIAMMALSYSLRKWTGV